MPLGVFRAVGLGLGPWESRGCVQCWPGAPQKRPRGNSQSSHRAKRLHKWLRLSLTWHKFVLGTYVCSATTLIVSIPGSSTAGVLTHPQHAQTGVQELCAFAGAAAETQRWRARRCCHPAALLAVPNVEP